MIFYREEINIFLSVNHNALYNTKKCNMYMGRANLVFQYVFDDGETTNLIRKKNQIFKSLHKQQHIIETYENQYLIKLKKKLFKNCLRYTILYKLESLSSILIEHNYYGCYWMVS